jgi:iron complex transport system substrate-binding protein
MNMSRRWKAALLLLALPAFSYAAGTTEESARTGVTDGAAEGFPVTVEHQFGSATVSVEPKRVVTVGFSEQDPVLATGIAPVAVRYWFGDYPYAVWPWAQEELGDATPEVLEMPYGELDFERIASLTPDLIVATHSGITAEEYSALSAIAPTLVRPEEYPAFGVPWQIQTRLVGRAVGRLEQAEAAIETAMETIESVAARNPEFDGAEIVFASPAEGQGQYWVFGPNTPPLRFLTSLGFTFPEELARIVGEQDAAQISSEQVRLLDVDVLVLQVGSEETLERITTDPIVAGLEIVTEGRIVPFVGSTDPLYGALSFSTVLSLPYAAENLEPLLQAAIDGDPETPVGQ